MSKRKKICLTCAQRNKDFKAAQLFSKLEQQIIAEQVEARRMRKSQ